MNRENAVIRFIAISVSLAFHAALVWGLADAALKARGKKSEELQLTRFTFKTAQATPPPPPEIPKPETKPIREPVKKIKPVENPKPAPKVEKKAEPKPEPVVAEAPPPPPEPVPEAVEEPPVMEARAPEVDRDLLELERQRYLARVMELIDGRKHYPGAARRRGIQGAVKVSFTLLHGGKVESVSAEGAAEILLHAAREAVEKSVPLPLPPDGVLLPINIECTMQFVLN